MSSRRKPGPNSQRARAARWIPAFAGMTPSGVTDRAAQQPVIRLRALAPAARCRTRRCRRSAPAG
ncbi:MAG: hypothetical protein EOP24_10080 [Hyphomicrobiales bacterium]|nr:MAG: hypothetical protein EOP24_10080 [Hyphomicrobiales bacterium]